MRVQGGFVAVLFQDPDLAALKNSLGPRQRNEPSTREEWDFSELRIPSQTHPGKVDVSTVVTQLGVPGFRFRFWFVRREHKE